MGKVRYALVVLATLALVPVPTGASAVASIFSCPDPASVHRHGDWYSIAVPHFPRGAEAISSFAVDAYDSERLFVTNGTIVLGSGDGGCRWSEVYRLPTAASSTGGYTEADSLVVEITPTSDRVVYLGIQQESPVARPHVLRSDDDGATWASAEGGEFVGSVGRLTDLAVGVSDPEVAYALVDVRDAPQGLAEVRSAQILWGTDDGGRTWERRSSLVEGADVSGAGVTLELDPSDVFGIEVDPLSPHEVWSYGSFGTLRSTDAGVTFSPVTFGATGVLDLHHRPGEQSRVLSFSSDDDAAYVSQDGGQSFVRVDAPGIVDSAGHGTDPREAMVGAGGRAYLLSPPRGPAGTRGFYDVSPADGRKIQGVSGASPRMIFGHTDRTIEVNPLTSFVYPPPPPAPTFELPPVPGGGDEARHPVRIDAGSGAGLPEGRIVPASSRIALSVNERRTLDYRLELPPSPTPLDVYFLVDVSSSMTGTIQGVREGMQEIVRRLAEAGVDAHFGVGVYRAFDDPPPYERVRDVLPVDQGLAAALNSLQAAGGGRETQLYALLRSVTGDEEGGRFTFRPGSMRVAIHATDEPFSTGGDHPDYATVIDALVDESVQQVGLAIQTETSEDVYEQDLPSGGLVQVAQGTGALAPPQGVDCDGDLVPDIAAGEPLVCEIDPGRSADAVLMADAIVNVVDSLEDRKDLRVVAHPPGEDIGAAAPVVRQISPRTFPDVDLKRENVLPFAIEYECPSLSRPEVFPVEIGVYAGSRLVGSARTVVECSVEAPPVPRVPAPDSPAALPPGPPAPPPAAPAPQPQPQPQPNPQPQGQPEPQSQPQAQGQPQLQAAPAPQHQEQPELAFVHAAHQVQDRLGGEYAMSSLRRPGPTALETARLLVGTTILTFAVGFTIARSSVRTVVSDARDRRR